MREQVRQFAGSPYPVLLHGETGTDKEVVARAVHDASPRRAAAFLAVNVAAITPGLAEAELFGVVKGAFTGADRDRPGYFQRADGGTLFLDEIGEAPSELQVKLLRALETREVQRVGSESVERVDTRIGSATDVDLESMMAAGEFRFPLLHRSTT